MAMAVTAMAATLEGVGLGLRRVLLDPLHDLPEGHLDFLEVAPENWIGVGGRLGHKFAGIAERYPIALHGLSLDIGGPRELDWELLGRIKDFMSNWQCPAYSEHLTACGDGGHLYDLMPLPFTGEMVHYVAARVRRVQDFLGCRIALENASYYASFPAISTQDMTEIEFIRAVIDEADCDLLLDVNNIYVNSINHGYDAYEFLAALPGNRASYVHVAGHFAEAEDLRVDTHGAAVIDPVWDLLAAAYRAFGPMPTLLERDFNIPAISVLLGEIDIIRGLRVAAEEQCQREQSVSF
jgi:uncharacterized protein (UPF0276 family)